MDNYALFGGGKWLCLHRARHEPAAKGPDRGLKAEPKVSRLAALDEQFGGRMEAHEVAHGGCHICDKLVSGFHARFEVKGLEPEKPRLAFQFRVKTTDQAIAVQNGQAEIAVDPLWGRQITFERLVKTPQELITAAGPPQVIERAEEGGTTGR